MKPNNRYQIDSSSPQSPSTYLANKKKRYYLASSNENIQMLTENQSKELSNVLFELRSQRDKLALETSAKIKEENDLKKKIDQINSKNKEISKNIKEKQVMLSSIQSLTEIKQIKKTEEYYNKKILSSKIDKMKKDVLLTHKGTNRYQEEEHKLIKEINKSIINHNNQKSKYNTVHLKITNQNEKNEMEKKEQWLHLEYYQEIIDHKASFIQAADERKQRQQMIALKAKNNTNDVNEKSIRKKLLLLKIINHYYALKMNKMIKDNQELEEAYSNIRDICGTCKLSDICKIIREKNQEYSYKSSLVEEKKEQRKQFKDRLNEIEKEYMTMLNEVVLKDQFAKTIEVVKTEGNEKDQNDLMKTEKELMIKLENTLHSQLVVELIYHKTIENIKYLYKIYFNDFDKGKINYTEFDTINNDNHTRNVTTIETNELSLSKPNEMEENNDMNTNMTLNNKLCKQFNNEEKAIEDYNSFLKCSLDSFHKLFFCYSKHDFIKAMNEKGMEKNNGICISSASYSRNNVRTLTKSSLSKINHHRSSVKNRTRKLYLSVSTEIAKNPVVEEEDDITPSEKKNQKDIMANFLNEIKREKEEYIRLAKRKPTLKQK